MAGLLEGIEGLEGHQMLDVMEIVRKISFYYLDWDAPLCSYQNFWLSYVFFIASGLNIWNCCCRISFKKKKSFCFFAAVVASTMVYTDEPGAWPKSICWAAADDSKVLYFQVKMNSLNSGVLQMWANCCTREGWSSNLNGDTGSAPLLSACFCLWGRCAVCCLPSLKEDLHIFFQSLLQ